jgi:hypothetical protein
MGDKAKQVKQLIDRQRQRKGLKLGPQNGTGPKAQKGMCDKK